MRKIEQIIKFKTTDGQIFDVHSNAVIHQEILDGIKKGCNSCLSSGTILIDKTNQKPSNYFGRQYIILEKCDKCNGKGYIE